MCTGAKSEKMVRSALRKVVRELKENDIIILSKPKIEIQNVITTVNLHGKINLEATFDVMNDVMYEPELCPGLIYQMGGSKCSNSCLCIR